MIATFSDKGTEDIFNGIDSKKARSTLPRSLWDDAHELLDIINAATHFAELAIPSSNGLHALKYDRKGQHAVKINSQYRICFEFRDGDFYDVEITDYHK